MQTRAAIDSLYRNCGGEGGIARRYAPRPPLRSGPPSPKRSGVIPPALYTQITHLKLSCPSARIYILAERVGFEPTNTVRCYTLSRRAPSTARPPLHAAARVPEPAEPIKFTVAQSPRAAVPRAAAGEQCAARWPPYWAARARSAAERRDRCPSAPAEAVQGPRWESPRRPGYSVNRAPPALSAAPPGRHADIPGEYGNPASV